MEKSKFFLLLHIIFNAIFVIAHEDEILNLPGLSFKPNFEHYSGFLQVRKNHFLHYWFVTSQRNPASDPLVFWFNGGPGCSSIDGLLNEMGPYTSNEDGTTLSQNPNAWNKYASIVYIEAPAGVGYSYSTDGNVQTDDDQTSTENYEAIKQFFSKHPDYRNRLVFITGESYGGIYIPTLTSRIINGLKEFNINLTGVAIGNGYLNEQLNIETIVRFAYGHGLVDEKVWNTVELECCRGCVDGCDLMQLGGACNKMVQDIYAFSWNGGMDELLITETSLLNFVQKADLGLNPYDLYRSCDSASLDSSFRTRAMKFGLTPKIFLGVFNRTTSPNLSPKNPKNNEKLKEVSVPCLNDTALTHYMNRQEVRKALNIPEELGKWEICSSEISSTYKQIYEDVSSFIKQIINAKVRVLLYYGDTDMACNFLMGQQFADRLGLRPVLKKSPWKFDGQIAGFKTVYEKQLTFLTVKGAGHMAPQWKAPEMAYAFKKFLLNKSI